MKEGTKLVVSSGQGSFVAFFLSWADDTYINAINRFGGLLIINQNDVEEFFV